MEVAFFEKLGDGRLRCGLCFHGCVLAEGSEGICRVRVNSGGTPGLPAYGLLSSLALDPMEKKPLYRFLPGKTVFSAGFYGCNLRCPFCQNWQISQFGSGEGRRLEPGELVALARRSGAPALAFTYSEPTVHFEYLREAASLARAAGLKTVLVTNGQLAPAPARKLLDLMDAVNLDIKSFSARTYSRTLKGDIDTALGFARLAASSSWLEVTTLVVPGMEDWNASIAGIASALAEISPSIPLHLSAYHPDWKHEAPPTPPALLHGLAALARKTLAHVYEGNLAGETSLDTCPSCGLVQVERRGYRVRVANLGEGAGEGRGGLRARAVCSACGAPAHFVLS